MMTDYSDPIRAVYAACVDECMTALCKHFNVKATGYSGTFAYQTSMLAKLGAVRREVADIIARHTYGMEGMVSEAVRTAMLKAVKEVEPDLQAAVRAGVVHGTDVPMDKGIQTALTSYSRQAVDQLNLVNTVMLESCLNNYRALVSNTTAYEAQLAEAQRILNAQTGKVLTGVSSHQQAVRQAVQQFARTGLTGFTDKAGHQWSPEAYAAMDIRTTVNNAARQAVLDRNEAYGNDLVSVPINATARPKCYPWQGKVISTADEARMVTDLNSNPIRVYARSETTYGEPDGLWGINCHHQPRPFFDGLSLLRGEVPNKADSDALYAQTQEQRRLERNLRNLKREAVMLDAAGDKEGFADTARKVKLAQAKLKEHCEHYALPMRSDRVQVSGYDRSMGRKASSAAKRAEAERQLISALRNAGVRGTIHMKPTALNVDGLHFDDAHINVQRTHQVSEQAAKSYIRNAKLSVTVWNGRYERYYSAAGAAYVDLAEMKIRTAFSSEEFSGDALRIMEVLNDHGH